MSKKKGGFTELMYKTIMPKVYGIGAAVVIIGALFKILHFTGADEMLMIGLSVEAGIFFLSAFEPHAKETDWTKVYPELAEDFEGHVTSPTVRKAGASNDSPLLKVDEMLKNAKVDQNLLDNLGKGLNNLATSASQMNNLTNAAVATNEYHTSSLTPVALQDGANSPDVAVAPKVEPAVGLLHTALAEDTSNWAPEQSSFDGLPEVTQILKLL